MDENRILFISKDGFPVEGIIGRPFVILIRRILWTRKITTYRKWLLTGRCKIID